MRIQIPRIKKRIRDTLTIFFALIITNVLASDDWHIRIIAKSQQESLEDRGAVIGELASASDQIDKHDLPEMEPFAAPFLTVVFKKEIAQEDMEFNSDFRKPDFNPVRTQKQWQFTVKSDDPTRDVTLSWEGDGRLDKMVLVDLATGAEIYPMIAGRVKDYTFNMAGETERDFLWKY